MQISMDRSVSLKILLPEMTHDRGAVDQFIKAARAGGKLNHPNIVQVFDAGQEKGRWFVAMELVDGMSVRGLLQKRGRKRALEAYQAVDIAAQVAGALAYIHGQSLAHRSVSPDNILVTRHGIPKLVNPGTIQPRGDSRINLSSRPGEAVDALQFLAPEVLRDPKSAGPLADVYSLAATLFLMLSGHPPFRGASELEITEKVQEGEHESLQKLQHSVPDELAKIVEWGLAAQPNLRLQTAAEFKEHLERIRERLR